MLTTGGNRLPPAYAGAAIDFRKELAEARDSLRHLMPLCKDSNLYQRLSRILLQIDRAFDRKT
jgi:hypothetical protein